MIRNIISAFFTRGLVAIVNLAVLLISSRQLGASIIGQVSLLVMNITIIQIVNEIYTGYSLVHFIAKGSLKKIYATGLLWTIGCITVLNLLFLGINIGVKELWIHAAVLSFMGTLGSFHSVIILAKQKTAAYNFLVFLQPAVLLVVLCGSVWGFHMRSIDSYIAAMYVSFSLTLIVSLVIVIKLMRAEKPDGVAFSANAIFRNGFINQAGNLAHTLSNRYNFYLIGSTALVGIFARASSLIESVWLIGAGITPLLLTRVANRQQDDVRNSRLAFLLSKISLLLSILSVIVVLCLPNDFFIFLLGPDFSNVKELMLYLSPGILCIAFSTVLSHYFSGTGEQKVQFFSNSLGLLVTVCTAPFLIARYQLIGACYAASLSYLMQAVAVTFMFMRRKDLKWVSLFSFKRDLELLKK